MDVWRMAYGVVWLGVVRLVSAQGQRQVSTVECSKLAT